MAAALAFTATPSLAQDPAAPFPAAPEPVIVVPDIAPPAPPEPTVAQPIEQSATPPAPEVEVAAPEPEAAPVATASPTRVAAPVVRAVPDPAPRAATADPAPVEEAAIAPPVVAAAPVVEAVPPPATTETPAVGDNTGILALAIGGLVFLALAIWGFVAIGRRKPVRRYVAETTAAKPVPAAPPPVAVRPAPVVVPRPRPAETPSFAAHPASSAGVLPHAGASVALPRNLPESYEEREALFNRMVDAKPDRANPFTDRRMRMKRARLILQSLGRDFGDAEPWIDLSQYPNNWPELARKRSAAA